MPKCQAQPNNVPTDAVPPKVTFTTTAAGTAQADATPSAAPAGNGTNRPHSQNEARNSKEDRARAVALQCYINCMQEPDLIIPDNLRHHFTNKQTPGNYCLLTTTPTKVTAETDSTQAHPTARNPTIT